MTEGKKVHKNAAAFHAAYNHVTDVDDNGVVRTDIERLKGARYIWDQRHPDARHPPGSPFGRGAVIFENGDSVPVGRLENHLVIHPVNRLSLIAEMAYADANGDGDVFREVNRDLLAKHNIEGGE